MVLQLVFLVSVVSSILLALGFVLKFKNNLDREKLSPFECGFPAKFTARMPFSIRFFLIALVFLVFDVELILVFPVVPAVGGYSMIGEGFTVFIVVFILLAGLFHEIFQGSLSWAS